MLVQPWAICFSQSPFAVHSIEHGGNAAGILAARKKVVAMVDD